jgi:hypothetical protein
MIVLKTNAQDKYVPKANEELYGTWTNENASTMQPQKSINFPGGYKAYEKITDTSPFEEGTEQIAEKWTDSEGNVWYKIINVITLGIVPSGPYKGYDYKGWKIQCLQKVSNSGTVREWTWVQVPAFDPSLYPTKIDPTDSQHYAIVYRAKE